MAISLVVKLSSIFGWINRNGIWISIYSSVFWVVKLIFVFLGGFFPRDIFVINKKYRYFSAFVF